jgi:prefoldin subunit 5
VPTPNQERIALVTHELRAKLDELEASIEDAQEALDELEEAAGLTRPDGSRVDEGEPPSAGTSSGDW